ncbi:phosphoribosyl-AMP cyclohydrolase [Candidatus Aerophobetes bacterium]|uniref:Phosphoribosyl-AMP cyclohydrolase n=1 Tax=Aerophobetes bacterium TaxID=2030807 RepID=A0A523TGG6_UNCAE|nr:MAG: phosphoribosyl-AMP cyclohydrolase [Candidatus Aerophobetes bacterium]
MNILGEVKFDSQGLVPVIVQDVRNLEILMMAWMSKDALQKTLSTGKVHFWSRSRQKIWLKGEESGHYQWIREIWVDCDGDTLLLKVEQTQAACHLGYRSCFFRKMGKDRNLKILGKKVFEPEKVYGENSQRCTHEKD